MAARLSPKHDELTRLKIRTTQLVKRLEKFSLGELDENTDLPVQMTDAQVRASLGLLKKSLPDLSNVEMSGEGGGPLVVEIVRFGGKGE